MPESDLSELVAGRSEDLGVEYKFWIDTSQPEVRAKLARHIAALADHGGGYRIFRVDDVTGQPQGATELDQALFSQDAISAIVRRYLEPRIQIRVDHAEHGGAPYPVVIVPSHGARPVFAAADGPQDDKGRSITALRRVALPVFDLFANAGWLEPNSWLTRELVEREFTKLQVAGMRLFDT